jgi:SSS family solute:Na+ symporter
VGLFFLAIFTRRANGAGALVGLVASAVVQYALQSRLRIHPWFFTTIGMFGCVVFGYLASLLIPVGRKSLEGLTIYTLGKPQGRL